MVTESEFSYRIPVISASYSASLLLASNSNFKAYKILTPCGPVRTRLAKIIHISMCTWQHEAPNTETTIGNPNDERIANRKKVNKFEILLTLTNDQTRNISKNSFQHITRYQVQRKTIMKKNMNVKHEIKIRLY